MDSIAFLAGLGIVLLCLLSWGFKYLPGERWQMLAVVPLRKNGQNHWLGANLTYYGFFVATSQLIALALLFVLLAAMNISIQGAIVAILAVLALSVPAAKIVAILVENKRHTFTIGGASFVGIITAPWIIAAIDTLAGPESIFYMPLIPLLAAMSVAYTLGEGLGRLGCISYGCCYGKPIDECGPVSRFLFSRLNFIFYGDNKKVAYEAKLHGRRLVPVQAITCLMYTAGALCGSYLFLNGRFIEALLLTMMLTQLWRIFSESMRADFRGFSRISAYQKMGLISVLYILGLCLLAESSPLVTPDIGRGLGILWNPAVILGLQFLWLLFFFIFGRSTVTTSVVSFDLLKEHI